MDDYRILRVIGQGSFGRALLVQHKDCESKWVLKEIQIPKVGYSRSHAIALKWSVCLISRQIVTPPPLSLKGRTGAQQSRREAVLLAKMNHPNIVAFKDSFEGLLELFQISCSPSKLTNQDLTKLSKYTTFLHIDGYVVVELKKKKKQ